MDQNPRMEVLIHGQREERKDCAASGDYLDALGDPFLQTQCPRLIHGPGVAQEVPRQWRQDRKPGALGAFGQGESPLSG